MKNTQTISEIIDVLRNSTECRDKTNNKAQNTMEMLDALLGAAAVLIATFPGDQQHICMSMVIRRLFEFADEANDMLDVQRQIDSVGLN